MKTNNYSSRSAILLLSISLFCSAFVTGQAIGAEPRSSTSQAPARLIITRMPNLGVNVIVELWIDGQRTATLGYARDYEGVLTPGRHVLGVLPTRSLSPTPWEMALNAQSGQTYIFSAGISSSGNVVLYSGGF